MTKTVDNTDPILKLDEAWIYKVAVLADRVARRSAEIAKSEAGMNLSQWRVLAAIADKPGRRARDVVAITPMDKGIVSRATAALIEAGFIRKQTSSSDGRVSHLFLTEAGEKIYIRLIDKLRDSGASGENTLSDSDEARFVGLLKSILDRYEPV